MMRLLEKKNSILKTISNKKKKLRLIFKDEIEKKNQLKKISIEEKSSNKINADQI